MKLRLNYVVPNGDLVSVDRINLDNPSGRLWLFDMVESNPDTIFFFTTDTTDIWED